MVNAGKLNKRVMIKQSVTGSPERNEFGEPNIEWQEVSTVWAAVEPLSGREYWAQQQVQSEIAVRIRIRYRDDVSAGMQVVYSGKIYMIDSVIDQKEGHKELHLMCSEGVRSA